MKTDEALPRRFGPYVLTARLGEDALGMVFRALRLSGDRAFTRLRILESDELAEDAILDAIEENGEIHTFLKNPAITRGVVMDSVGGVPFIAWNEESGRTLDALLARVRSMGKRVPTEHSLLIAEKVATALDHAYNTTVDGERTLHGLVWPGFVSLSDDGETRLTGFGLAQGVLPALSRPRLSAEIAPYLASEERGSGNVGRNSDVYSVGAFLFELLTGRLPSPADPLGDLRAAAKDPASPLAAEIAAILRLCLSPTETRYQSSGELRRELGKLLFSGPYAPSTFNLAFYLSGLFGIEIEAENRGRAEEASLDTGAVPELTIAPMARAWAPSAPRPAARAAGSPPSTGARPGHTKPLPWVIALVAALAVGGGIWAVLKRATPPQPSPVAATPSPSPAPQPSPTAEPAPASTSAMSEAQFQAEVSRRVGQEMRRIEQNYKTKQVRPAEGTPAGQAPEPTPSRTEAGAPAGGAAPALEAGTAVPTPTAPEPTPPPVRPASTAVPDAIDTPPKILSVVKPVYPPFALRTRVGGVVILRVLISETGLPLDVEVLQGVGGGLTEAAVDAVKRWKFQPGRRNGAAVRTWTTIPIPFEP